MKFCPNISTLFQEHSFLERFDEAKKFGFTAVEIQFPYDYEAEVLGKKKRETGLQVVLLNTIPGDDFGCGSIPGRETEFLCQLSQSLKYTFQLGVKRLHILSGLKNDKFTEEEQMNCFVENLKNAAETLEEHNIIGLLEPISSEVKKNYFLDSFEKAVTILKKVDNQNIKLLLDIYHLKKIQGEVSLETLQKFYEYAGHIQISQDPGRCEPFHKNGLINYDMVFEFLKNKKYEGFIGLEYFASESTLKSLCWVKNFKF